MWIYWTAFFLPAIGAFGLGKIRASSSKIFFFLYSLFLILLIGLRFQVGADWDTYLIHLDNAKGISFFDALKGNDSGYGALNWFANVLGFGVWSVNLACATIFVTGLLHFCKRLPNPWLALTIAAPYITIVFAMNYTRQATAFGFILFALSVLQRSRLLSFLLFILFACLFHKSAILLAPLGLLITLKNRILTFSIVAIFAVLSFYIFLLEAQDALYELYITGAMESQGAWVRVLMNALPSAAFLLMLKHFILNPMQRKIYITLSVVSLLFIPILMVSPSSTAADRIALFLLPIQMYILSQLPISVKSWGLKYFAIAGILLTYATAMFVWLNFSVWRSYWIPYKFYPFEMI